MICSIVSLCLYAVLVFISTSHVSLVLVFDFQHIGHIIFVHCIGFHHKHFGHITIRFGCLVLQTYWSHKISIPSYVSKTFLFQTKLISFLFQTKSDFILSVWGGYGNISVLSMAKGLLADVVCIQRANAFGTIVYG